MNVRQSRACYRQTLPPDLDPGAGRMGSRQRSTGTITPEELDALVVSAVQRVLPGLQPLAQVDRMPPDVDRGVTPDNKIADGSGSSDLEEPMYRWISAKPYRHHDRWRVWFKTLDGEKSFKTFDLLEDALTFISTGIRRTLRDGGHAVGDVLDEYLASRRDLRPSSIRTVRFRLDAIFRARRAIPVEAFPWSKAWNQYVVTQSVDSQHGIAGALRGFLSHCQAEGFVKKAPSFPPSRDGSDGARPSFESTKRVSSSPKRFVRAIRSRSRLRPWFSPGFGLARSWRWRCGTATTALRFSGWSQARRTRPDERSKSPQSFARSSSGSRRVGPAGGSLFQLEPRRQRASKDESKSRTDALLRRLRRLCSEAKVPAVVPHSLRGLHATLASGFGATSHAVAAALGHTSFVVTERHYVDRDALEQARSRRSRAVLSGGTAGASYSLAR